MKKILLFDSKSRKMFKNVYKSCFLLLILVGITSAAFGSTNFDNQTKNFSFKDMSIKDALKHIIQDTQYDLTYSQADIEKIDKVSLELKNTTTEIALNKVLGENGLTYTIRDNNIIISRIPVVKQQPQQPQQQKKSTIIGKVIGSDTKKPLVGVTVIIKGTNIGAITDSNGDFSINFTGTTADLEFSYVGYKQKESKATANQKLIITLEQETLAFDDVVVVAYGTAKKNSITGSVAVINTARIESAKVSNISQALQGTSPGIQTISSSGQPGSEATIRIRGIGSVNASSDPLYILDGVPYDGSINSINPSDISSITVLKDAASSALYGSRGANGVIIVTTKQGRVDAAPKINVSASYGISNRALRDYDQLTTDEYYMLQWEALRNAQLDAGKTAGEASTFASSELVSSIGINPYGSKYANPVDENGKLVQGARAMYNGEWADELIKTANRSEMNLNISGGSKTATYYASAGYLNDQGIAITSGFERFTTKLNGIYNAKKWLTLTFGLSGTYSDQNAPKSDDSAISNVIGFARSVPGFYPVYKVNEDGLYINDKGGLAANNGERVYDFGDYRKSSYKGYNLAATLPHDKSQVERYTMSSRMAADFKIYKGLSFKTSFSFDLNNRMNNSFTNSLIGPSEESGGSVSRSVSTIKSWTFNNILNYNTKINKHEIDLLAGQEAYKYTSVYTGGSASSFPLPNFSEPDAASIVGGFSGYSDVYTLLGYLGQAKYIYDDKYSASASIRTDGSSRFHTDNRWGTFWSVGGSWDISKEAFLANNQNVNRLIMKVSYGSQGNDNLGNYYAYQQLYSLTKNNNIGAAQLSRLDTPELKWESNLNFNIGVDFALLNNRLTGSVEYFTRSSKDLLFSMPIAPSLGLSSYDANVGSMSNKGIEVDLGVTIIRKNDIEWKINANLTHYKSTLTSLPRAEIISGTKRMIVGSSIYDFWVKEYAGTSKVGEKVITSLNNGAPVYSESKGGAPLWYYTDSKGEKIKTSNYSTATYDYHGSSLPDFYGGFGTDFKYKNFQLQALFSYSVGGKILNQDESSLLGTGSGAGNSWSKKALDRWTPENQDSEYPRLTTKSYTNGWTSTSTAGLVDASYMRLKNLTLTYNFGSNLLEKANISKASVYIQGENIFTLFGTQGLDPEIAGISGVSYFRYPIMRTFSMGINITF